MKALHSLLARQLRRFFGNSSPTLDKFQTFIDSVNEAYQEFDTDRAMLERTLDLSSQELIQANSEMRRKIADQKKAERLLKENEEHYRTIFENTGNASILIAKDTTILLANSNFEKLAGYSKEEMEGKMSWTVFIYPVDMEMMKQYHEKRRNQPEGVPSSYEFRFITRSGGLRDIFLTVSMIPGTNESIASCMDITERKRAEEELRQSEERYRNILDSMEEAYYEVDLRGDLTFINSSGARLVGYSVDELLRMNFADVMDKENVKNIYETFNRVYTSGESTKLFDWEFITKSGEKVIVEASASLNLDAQGNPIGFRGVGRNITERKKAEKALMLSEAKYRYLTEKMNDVVWTTDLEFNLTYVSPSIEKLMGFSSEEMIGVNASKIMTPPSFEYALDTLGAELQHEKEAVYDPERAVKIDLEYYHRNGSTIWVENLMSAIRDDSGRFIGIHGVTRNITERKMVEAERKRLEIQLAQAQKMESLGTLAGGIAHDFNNILSAIIGYAQLAMNDVLIPDKSYHEINEVLKAGDRAKNLVGQILTFSRQREIKQQPVCLQSVVSESLQMLRSIIPSTIELRHDLKDSGLVLSDPTQINQVIMNLCTNAVQAMDKTGGVLEVGIMKMSINEYEARNLDLSPGPFLKLTVNDNGQGMTSEVMARIFDPYFTTKEVGRGTGLGLSVVHGIVKSHGGTIICTSKPGKGTTFDIYLPELETGKEALYHGEIKSLPIGNERILFIDDEQVLVELGRKMMENLGYTVFTRTSSIEALEFFRNDPDNFDLIITDMTMPGITGDTLAQKIMEIRHDIPIILCTGYSMHISEERAKKIGIRKYIMKPLVMKELAHSIRNVLDGKQDNTF